MDETIKLEWLIKGLSLFVRVHEIFLVSPTKMKATCHLNFVKNFGFWFLVFSRLKPNPNQIIWVYKIYHNLNPNQYIKSPNHISYSI